MLLNVDVASEITHVALLSSCTHSSTTRCERRRQNNSLVAAATTLESGGGSPHLGVLPVSLGRGSATYMLTMPLQVGLWEVGTEVGTEASVRYVQLETGASDMPSTVELQEALPLESLLASVGTCKDAIVAASRLIAARVVWACYCW